MGIKGKSFWHQIILILICAGINYGGRIVADSFSLPVWLDCVGTYLAAYYLPAYATISTAVISQFFVGIRNPIVLLYSITALAVALAFRYCRKNGHMEALTKAVIASFWIGILCVVISTPLNVTFYNGYSGNMWGDALVDMLQWYNVPLIPSSIAGEIIVEVVDKQICVITGYFLIRAAEGLKRKNLEICPEKRFLFFFYHP